MIEMIPGLPGNVVGFTAKTPLTEHDYTHVLRSLVSASLSAEGKIRLLFHIGPVFTQEEARAMWADPKLGLKHMAAWDRVAAVADMNWLPAPSRTFGAVMPGRIKVFSRSQFFEARKWVQA